MHIFINFDLFQNFNGKYHVEDWGEGITNSKIVIMISCHIQKSLMSGVFPGQETHLPNPRSLGGKDEHDVSGPHRFPKCLVLCPYLLPCEGQSQYQGDWFKLPSHVFRKPGIAWGDAIRHEWQQQHSWEPKVRWEEVEQGSRCLSKRSPKQHWENIKIQWKYKDWTIAQTVLYSPNSQENGEFGKYGIMKMENTFCCDQIPIVTFHLLPRVQVMQYIINRCCKNFCLLTWKQSEVGGFWKSAGSGA